MRCRRCRELGANTARLRTERPGYKEIRAAGRAGSILLGLCTSEGLVIELDFQSSLEISTSGGRKITKPFTQTDECQQDKNSPATKMHALEQAKTSRHQNAALNTHRVGAIADDDFMCCGFQSTPAHTQKLTSTRRFGQVRQRQSIAAVAQNTVHRCTTF